MNLRLAFCLSLVALGCAGDDAMTPAPDATLPPVDPFVPPARPTQPTTPLSVVVELPAHARASLTPGSDNTPPANPITNAGATLGRVLFHDRSLSANATIACASCHRANVGFADDKAASAGFEGGATGRTSMALIEVRYYRRGRMFWDERATTLEDQVLRPIQDAVEMGLTLDELVARVASIDYYPALFTAAFGDAQLTSDRISRALSQYVRSIVSFGSRWDQGVTQVASIADPFPNFSAEENRGKTLFFGQHNPMSGGLCGHCHMPGNPLDVPPPGPNPAPPLINVAFFQPFGPTDNGLPPAEGDLGVGGETLQPVNNNQFKPSSLRNVALTAPYMHDGRFATLADVVDFYDRGITRTPNLHPVLRDPMGNPVRLNLSPADRAALVAFLGTLTDTSLATDPRFADPFAP